MSNLRTFFRKQEVFDNDLLQIFTECGVVNAPSDFSKISEKQWNKILRKSMAERSKELKSADAKNRFEKKLKKIEKIWKQACKNKKNGVTTTINDTNMNEKEEHKLTPSTKNWNRDFAKQRNQQQLIINQKYQQKKKIKHVEASKILREWLKKENVFDKDIMKLLAEYGVIHAPYDLRKINQQQWDILFRKSLAEKSKELKSQAAKNRFEKKFKRVEKLWKKERNNSENKDDSEQKSNTLIQSESIANEKEERKLTPSTKQLLTKNNLRNNAKQRSQQQAIINQKYQQKKKIKNIEATKNLRDWLKKENVFDNDIMKLLAEYGVIHAPYDLRKINQQQWDALFRKGLAEKSKELKSQAAKNRFEKRFKRVEKLWKKERTKTDNNDENEETTNRLIQSESNIILPTTIIANEDNNINKKKKQKKKKEKAAKYMDLSSKMNMWIAIEECDFKMLQTVQQYHARNIVSEKKGSITGLHYCCQYERPKMLKYLLQNAKLALKINLQNYLGNTPAFVSIIRMSEYKAGWSSYSFDCLKLLCEWKSNKSNQIVDLNKKNLKGRTILMYTALHNQVHVMEYLLSLKDKNERRRIDIEIQDKQKQTAILYAVKHCHYESVMILTAHGARCDVKNITGHDVSDYATGKSKVLVDVACIRYCVEGLKSVRDIQMKNGINIPMELIYIIIHYACDMGGKLQREADAIAEKTNKLIKAQRNHMTEKQKRKQQRHTGPQTGADYTGWFG